MNRKSIHPEPPKYSAGSTRPAGRRFYAREELPVSMVSNVFGTIERTRFLFRDTLRSGAAFGGAEGRSEAF